MNEVDICVVYAPVITLAIAILKRIPFIGRNPKWVAFALSIALNTLATGIIRGVSPSIPALVGCVLASWGIAIGGHEAVLDRKNGLAAKLFGV